MKAKSEIKALRVEIPEAVLESVFEECDRYDRDETGGRVVGHLSEDSGTLVVRAAGVIEPGPNARRTPTSFFQDGEYQTEIFRRLEKKDPSIEHLGNWHSHHGNGFPTLSSGDIATYRRIVNHDLHNLDLFYALLVTKRNEDQSGLDRYEVRHYVLFRGEEAVLELPPTDVRVTDGPRVWPMEEDDSKHSPRTAPIEGGRMHEVLEVRANDRKTLEVLCPSMEPRLSSQSGTLYWKGSLSLIDGSALEVKVVEVGDGDELLYYPLVSDRAEDAAELCETPFPSASHAVRALEWRMNRRIYDSVKR